MKNRGSKISILTPSLNTGEYLLDTLKTISKQNFKNYEHIIVDGGSTDETINILESQNQSKWISRKEHSRTTAITDAYREAFDMSSGDYIMQCCISDGYLDDNWFQICVEYLDKNSEISLVYGLPQYLNADGTFGRIAYHDFFDHPPPSGQEGLAFLIATGFLFPEGNYCVRRSVFEKCFPVNDNGDIFKSHPALGFLYNFITKGYIAVFIPRIANYGRVHHSRQVWNKENEKPIEVMFYKLLRKYGVELFFNKKVHLFRSSNEEIIGKVSISKFRYQLIKHLLLNLKILRLSPIIIFEKMINKVRYAVKRVGRKEC